MKFLQISYHNYRCFKDDITIKFSTNPEKNISLIIAPNGGGKTEMLFSFWYVLYDFDFDSLKEKKDTNYSLNSSSYLKIKNAKIDDSDSCFVTLTFDYEGTKYVIQRKDTFTKKSSGIIKQQGLYLIRYDKNGTKTPPLSDPEAITRIIEKIIPKTILNGIIFDGERMKELSKAGTESRLAIEGVIRDITNEELYEMCKIELEDIKKKVNKDQKKIAESCHEKSIQDILDKIETCENENSTNSDVIRTQERIRDVSETERNDVLKELKEDQTSRDNEIRREILKKQLDNANSRMSISLKNFYESLSSGYLLLSDSLLKDIENTIKSEKIPEGLLVKAVQSILHSSNHKCICGNDIGEKEREELEKLITKLPPDNINSTILQMVKTSKYLESEATKNIRTYYEALHANETEIEGLKKDIVEISRSIIGDGVTERVKVLEKKREELDLKINLANRAISDAEEAIRNNNKILAGLLKERNSYSENNSNLLYLAKKESIIDNFLKSLKEIDIMNGRNALMNLNQKLDKAYSLISEDYERGRRIYIVQFEPREKFRLVSYYANDYSNKLIEIKENGTLESYKMSGLTGDEIQEKIILGIKTSNSTGQSKINTLAFAKAILDYSNETRDEDSIEITKDYPFMIDSPFTELSGDNLVLSSKEMHNFASQILLMISDKSYETVKDRIEKYVGSLTRIKKNPGESRSTLEE